VKWSILVLTQPTRKFFLGRLLRVLEPQVKEHPEIELLVRESDPEMVLGENRERLRQASTGEYLNFVDDDDLVATDYVARIFPLLDGVDYVGFRLQQFVDGKHLPPTFHSLVHERWRFDDKGFYRDISHLNPMRRDLALSVAMTGGRGEDARWSDAVRAKRIVKTEHYVEETMYFYYFRSNKSDGGQARKP
jgi:hypothetical protein